MRSLPAQIGNTISLSQWGQKLAKLAKQPLRNHQPLNKKRQTKPGQVGLQPRLLPLPNHKGRQDPLGMASQCTLWPFVQIRI